MVWKPYRNMLLCTGLFTSLVCLVLAGCGEAPSVQSSRFIFPSQSNTMSPDQTSFTPAGSAVWILSCLDGWEKQKIYQTNPYYINQQGIKTARDIYVFGDFWLQPGTGTLRSYADHSALRQCLSHLLSTAHSQYHAQVCGVISVDEGSGSWKSSDVVTYTKRATTTWSCKTKIWHSSC